MLVEIACLREEHTESFHAALDVVAREHRYLSLLEAPPLAATREFVARGIASRHPHIVALHGDRVVSWCDVHARSGRPTGEHVGRLGMGLLPEWRGQGLGERLIRRTIDASRTLGLARVELEVRADNARAIALYRKVGFELEGRRRRALRVDGVYYDLIMMALLFDAPT